MEALFFILMIILILIVINSEDPTRHLLYNNLDDFVRASEKWLKHPKRRPSRTLGVGIDRSDSLLYEGVIPHVRSLAPLTVPNILFMILVVSVISGALALIINKKRKRLH